MWWGRGWRDRRPRCGHREGDLVPPTDGQDAARCTASSRPHALSWRGLAVRVSARTDISLTFALRRVLPARPNYIWFVCNTYHAKKARNSLSEDLPSFLSSRFLACCCFPCFCAAPRERRTARFTATSAWWRIAACPAPDPCSAPFCIWAR